MLSIGMFSGHGRVIIADFNEGLMQHKVLLFHLLNLRMFPCEPANWGRAEVNRNDDFYRKTELNLQI